jgi:NAD-dependent deacetylase
LSRKKLVVLTGAGISAESGLKTFRDSNGLWEGFDVMEVASIDGWHNDQAKVLDFYNMRRKQALSAKPNAGHIALAQLEEMMEVTIITQNVDNLHEQAGSTKVIHLHGELFKSKSTIDDSLIYDMKGWELNVGDLCEKGGQLRPHIVWFGEMVPLMEVAAELVGQADLFMVVGTSLAVYPAASLIDYALPEIDKYIIDPTIPNIAGYDNLTSIAEPASTGIAKAVKMMMDKGN